MLRNDSNGIFQTTFFSGAMSGPVGLPDSRPRFGFTLYIPSLTSPPVMWPFVLPGAVQRLSPGSGAPAYQSVATSFLTVGPPRPDISKAIISYSSLTPPGTPVYFEVICPTRRRPGSYADTLWRGHSAPFSETMAMGTTRSVSYPPSSRSRCSWTWRRLNRRHWPLLGLGGLVSLGGPAGRKTV